MIKLENGVKASQITQVGTYIVLSPYVSSRDGLSTSLVAIDVWLDNNGVFRDHCGGKLLKLTERWNDTWTFFGPLELPEIK